MNEVACFKQRWLPLIFLLLWMLLAQYFGFQFVIQTFTDLYNKPLMIQDQIQDQLYWFANDQLSKFVNFGKSEEGLAYFVIRCRPKAGNSRLQWPWSFFIFSAIIEASNNLTNRGESLTVCVCQIKLHLVERSQSQASFSTVNLLFSFSFRCLLLHWSIWQAAKSKFIKKTLKKISLNLLLQVGGNMEK